MLAVETAPDRGNRLLRARWALAILLAALTMSPSMLQPAQARAAEGALDPTFGTAGIQYHELGGPDGSYPAGVALLENGESIVGFTDLTAKAHRVGVARLTAGGKLDTTYGSGGSVSVPIEGNGEGFAKTVAVDHSGRAVLVAYRSNTEGSGLPTELFVARFTVSGELDPTFNAGSKHPGYTFFPALGFLQTPGHLTSTVPAAVTITPDNGIDIAGTATTEGEPAPRGTLVRLTSAGEPDFEFGAFGAAEYTPKSTAPVEYNAIAQQGSNLVVAGHSNDGVSGIWKITVARFTASGGPDETFGAVSTPGRVEFNALGEEGPDEQGHAIAVDPTGRLYVAGSEQVGSGEALMIARLTHEGALDPTWDPTGTLPGVRTVEVGVEFDAEATAVAVRPGGGAFVAGVAFEEGRQDFLAGAFDASGAPEAGYGKGGFVLQPVGSESGELTAAVRGEDDTLLALGGARSSGKGILALARWLGDPVAVALGKVPAFPSQALGTTSGSQPLTITNTSRALLHLGAIEATPDFLVADPSGCGGSTLGFNATCTVQVSFKPTATGARTGSITVKSNAAAGTATAAVSGTGAAPELPVTAKVQEAPASAGDSTTVEAKVTTPEGSKIIGYKWSTEGPNLSSASVETGDIDQITERVGPGVTTIWVWGVDNEGHVSSVPAEIHITAPTTVCAPGSTTGDLRVGWLHIRSSECIRRSSGGNDFVVPLSGGGASIDGLEVLCPKTGTCGSLTINHTGTGVPLAPGDSRAFELKSTTPVALRWDNGQTGAVELGTHVLSFQSPAGASPTARVSVAPRARAAVRELENVRPGLPPPPPIVAPHVEQPLGSFEAPAGTELGTLNVKGSVTLSVFAPQANGEPGMKLTTDVEVPVPGSSAPEVAPVSQEASATSGPKTDGTKWEVQLTGLAIFPLLHFENFGLKYQAYVPAENGNPAEEGVFSFEAVVGIDITGWTVAAEGVFSKTNGFDRIAFGFERNAGQGVTGLNIPLGKRSATGLATREAPIQLEQLSGVFQLHPFLEVGGSVKVLLAGTDTAGGSFKYYEAHEGHPWGFFASVTFPIDDFTVTGGFEIDGSPKPGFGLSGEVEINIEEVLSLAAHVYAYFDYNETTKKAEGEFGLGGEAKFLSFQLASFKGLINQNAVAGCGSIGLLQAWGAYEFASEEGTGGFGPCSEIAKYSLAPTLAGLARRHPHARVAVSKLQVPAGVSWANLEVRAASGLARVKVEGPGGVSYTSPGQAGVSKPSGSEPVAMVDEHSHRTVIGLHDPKPGSYTVSTVPGSPAITGARIAFAHPTTVTAKVAGSGAKRVLRYRVRAPRGTKVVFEERAGSLVHTLGAAKRASGTLPIRTSDLGLPSRTIFARITAAGKELPAQEVASYTAPKVVPGAPRHLKIAIDRKRALATVTWARDPQAATYEVTLATKSGRRLRLRLTAPRLLVPSVYPGDVITVTVRGVTRFQNDGPRTVARTRIAAARKPKPKRKGGKTKS